MTENEKNLLEILKEWVWDKVDGPFFHEDEHGPESLLNRTREIIKKMEG